MRSLAYLQICGEKICGGSCFPAVLGKLTGRLGREVENMKEEEKFAVAEAMTRHGGSFVKALGQALMLADSDNAEKIKTAFREYWEKYWEIYKKVKRK